MREGTSERGTERERENPTRGRQREREKWGSCSPEAGLELTNSEIMT